MVLVRLAVALLLLSVLVPAVQAEPLPLHALRIGSEYKLGPKDTEGHQTGNWGSALAGPVGAPYTGNGREWAFAAVQPFPGVVTLDPAGKVHVSVWIGGGSSEGGMGTAAWDLKAGTTLVASGAGKDLQYLGGNVELVWDETPAISSIDPALGDLVFRVFTTETFALGLRITLGPDPEWTQLTLPVLGIAGGSTIQMHALNGTTASIQLASARTNATHQYEWPSPGGALELKVSDATRTGGNATIRVLDGANATLANVTFNGTAVTKALSGAAGNWTIEVVLQDYSGTLQIAIAPPSATTSNSASVSGTGQGSSGTGGTGSSGAGTNGTGGNSTSFGGGKDSPGPALPLLLGALAIVALVRRRR